MTSLLAALVFTFGPQAEPAPHPQVDVEARTANPQVPVWVALAACESGGDPTAVSPSGRYRGLYQFDVTTWASVGGSGDPAAASASEQTLRAKRLQAARGWSPWPACSRQLDLR